MRQVAATLKTTNLQIKQLKIRILVAK